MALLQLELVLLHLSVFGTAILVHGYEQDSLKHTASEQQAIRNYHQL